MSCRRGGSEEHHPQVCHRFPRVSCRGLFANSPLFYPLSLVKIEDDRLQALLDEIQAMRKFQT